MNRHRRWPWRAITTIPLRGGLPLHHGMLPRLLQWFFHPPDGAPPATLLIRLMAGGVFLWEGVMKFVFPHTLGVGRFLKLGIPAPEFMAPFVGVMEIVGGTLFIVGLFTRLAALPLLIDIVVAIASTKIPLLLGTSPLPPPPVPPQVGFWAVLHEIRADDAQLLCSLFLLLVGAGPWALDTLLARRRGSARPQEWQQATMPQGTCVTEAQLPINTLRT
jgi:putative oxidoreductase